MKQSRTFLSQNAFFRSFGLVGRFTDADLGVSAQRRIDSLSTPPSDGRVERDSIEPREKGALPLERVQLHIRLNQRLLNHILGLFARPRDMVGRLKQPILVPDNQFFECLRLSRKHLGDYLGIVCFRCVAHERSNLPTRGGRGKFLDKIAGARLEGPKERTRRVQIPFCLDAKKASTLCPSRT